MISKNPCGEIFLGLTDFQREVLSKYVSILVEKYGDALTSYQCGFQIHHFQPKAYADIDLSTGVEMHDSRICIYSIPGCLECDIQIHDPESFQKFERYFDAKYSRTESEQRKNSHSHGLPKL